MNLTKKYDDFLDLLSLTDSQARSDLKSIYRRDFETTPLRVIGLPIEPMPGQATVLDRVFNHLISRKYDDPKRELDRNRAKHLHWIKPHIVNTIQDEYPDHKLDLFTIEEDGKSKLYILNHTKKYVVVLEMTRDKRGYFLLTAFPFDSDREYQGACRKQQRGTPA